MGKAKQTITIKKTAAKVKAAVTPPKATQTKTGGKKGNQNRCAACGRFL